MTLADAEAETGPGEPAEDEFAKKRRRLFAFLDDLKRGDLELGPSDYTRIDRVLILLKSRGIDPDDPRAAAWLAPLLCGTPGEQEAFHRRFRAVFGEAVSGASLQAPKGPLEIAVEKEPRREARRRGWLLAGIGIAVACLVALGVILLDPWAMTDTPAGSVAAQLRPDVSTSLLNRPLILVPIALLGIFLLWRRSRRLRLLREFAPSTDRSEKVVLAATQAQFYAEPGVRRAFGAFRRHWASPGGRLHVRRSVRATMRAGGRPELRFGTRPRTPEYVLLVDCETPRDHVAAAATVLLQQFTAERVIVTRYDYFGDPRRLTPVAPGGPPGAPMRLLDVAGVHADQTILIVAEAHTFFDEYGSPRRWLPVLREWGRVILLTPRAPELWDWPERELERQGIRVIPALPEGLVSLAEQLKFGPALLLDARDRIEQAVGASASFARPIAAHRSRNRAPRLDIALQLDGHRDLLLDEANPPEEVVSELLSDLRIGLGPQSFQLLQALAVFPRLEPALTIYLGTHLLDEGQPLLDEERLLALSRLPWLRIGRMPDWLRRGLVRELDRPRLNEILDLLQSFLQPIQDPQTGVLTLDVSRRCGSGFRRLLREFIGIHPATDLEDRILVDALDGRDPAQLGVTVPDSLRRKLQTLFRRTDGMMTALAVTAAIVVGLLHSQIIGLLRGVASRVLALLAPLDPTVPSLPAWLPWTTMAVAFAAWLVEVTSRRDPHPKSYPWSLGLAGAAVLFAVIDRLGDSSVAPLTVFLLLLFAFVSVVRWPRDWRLTERVPSAHLFLSPGPMLLEVPLFAVWIACSSVAATGIALHDRYLGPYFLTLEFASFVFATLLIFCKTRFYPAASRCSLSDAWRAALIFGLGQCIIPLLTLGLLLSVDSDVRAAVGKSALLPLALTATRLFSGVICLLAVTGENRRYVSVASLCLLAVALFGTVILTRNGGLSSFFESETLLVATSAMAAAVQLRSLTGFGRLLLVVGLSMITWGGIRILWFFLKETPSPSELAIAVAASATVSYVGVLAALRLQATFDPGPPRLQALGLLEIVREARSSLAASMPWPLVPLLWLAGLWFNVGGRSFDFSYLFLPAAVWFGCSYPQRAIRVLLVGGLPLLAIISLGPMGTRGDLDVLAASLALAWAFVNRRILEDVFEANTITATQLLLSIVMVGIGASFTFEGVRFVWSGAFLGFVIVVFIGLSSIAVRWLAIVFILAALIVPPVLNRAGFDPVNPGGLLLHPSRLIGAAALLMFGRAIRATLEGNPFGPAAERFLINYWGSGALSALVVGVNFVSLNVDYGGGTVDAFYNWHGLLPPVMISPVCFWAGLRFGRMAVLAALVVFAATDAALSLLPVVTQVLSVGPLPYLDWTVSLGIIPADAPMRKPEFVAQLLAVAAAFGVLGWKFGQRLGINTNGRQSPILSSSAQRG